MSDPKNVETIIAGVTIDGYGEDDAELSPVTEEAIDVKKGIRGEESINENPENHGILTLPIWATAKATRQLLDGLRVSKKSFPLVFKDFSEDSSIIQTSPNARIKNRPTHTRGKEASQVTYIIHIPDYNPVAL